MVTLWYSDRGADWQAALDRYPETLAAQGVRDLVALDRWYQTRLPALLARRRQTYLTPKELQQVTRWKMRRGVWRERNRLLVVSNPPAVVKEISAEAFAAIPDLRRPVAILSRLAGVGPATASAVLAAFRPDLYPFFDEWIANSIPGLGPVVFTAPYYQSYAARLRERAAELNTANPDVKWTAHALGQALWAASGGKAPH